MVFLTAFTCQLTSFLQQNCDKLRNISEEEVHQRLHSEDKISDFRVDELSLILRYLSSHFECPPLRGPKRKKNLSDAILNFLHSQSMSSHFLSDGNLPSNFNDCDYYFQKTQHPLYKVHQNILTRQFPRPYPSKDAFRLDITPEILAQLRLVDGKFAVVARLWIPSETPPVTCWDPSHHLAVNNCRVDVTDCMKKLRGTINEDKVVTFKPADVTSFFANYNRTSAHVSFESPSPSSGSIVFQFVSKISIQEAAQEVLSRPVAVSSSFDLDDDLMEDQSEISLMDPLTFTRITTPARGLHCTHRECFDVFLFLQHSVRLCVWQCSICNKPLPYPELRYDEWFDTNLLKNAPDSAELAIISQEGTKLKVVYEDETSKDGVSDSDDDLIHGYKQSSNQTIEVINVDEVVSSPPSTLFMRTRPRGPVMCQQPTRIQLNRDPTMYQSSPPLHNPNPYPNPNVYSNIGGNLSSGTFQDTGFRHSNRFNSPQPVYRPQMRSTPVEEVIDLDLNEGSPLDFHPPSIGSDRTADRQRLNMFFPRHSPSGLDHPRPPAPSIRSFTRPNVSPFLPVKRAHIESNEEVILISSDED
ncbi:hypothetical protein P9112_003915 [Eukaryota sp. TZLM1-RC]